MNNGRIFYHQNYVLEIAEEIGAIIGFRTIPGESLSFYFDSEIYKNFTITEDGITGDLVDVGETTQPFQIHYGEPVQVSGVLSNDWTPATRYGADGLLCAVYITDVTTEQPLSTSTPKILFYDEARDRFDSDYYYNSGGNTTSSIVLNDNAKVELINYQNGKIVHETYTMGHLTGSYVPQINNAWINAGYAQWVKWGSSIPIFDTEAHAKAYLRDTSITEGLLNASSDDPAEKFINDQKYYKLKNLYARGSGSSWTPVKNLNYRIKPIGGKICLYYHKPTKNEPYEWILKAFSGYYLYKSDGIIYDDDDDFTQVNTIETRYLQNSIAFDDVQYRVNIFDTDIPRWQTEQDADDYINGVKDITEALNYDYIARTNQEILGPDIGLADAGDDNGTNGMVYSYGSRMYVMSSLHLAGFFSDVFNTANIDDILDGTKLFGMSQISAISGISYFPCAISEFCDVASAGATPHIGSWVCPTATSDGYVVKNNKLIDCGGDLLKPIYGDFRDLEPYQQLWVTLPFCGTHQLQLTKYLNKYISFKYSIDAVTGACSCHVYADGIELDTFDGVCSSQRPITAIDQTTYLSNVIGSVNSALTSGVSGVSSGAQAIGGLMTGNVGSVVGGSAGMLGAGASGILGAYNVMQAVDNPPMTTRGGSSGCLGFFGCTQIHLHFYQKKTVKPIHALMLCGAPSNVSGTVSSFAGYLKCSTFKMSDGFTGTNDELNEIMQLMSNGIYV